MTDIPLILDSIRPGAKWRRAGTYQELVDTWEDTEQTLPTEQEINDAEAAAMAAQATRDGAPSVNACLEALMNANLANPTVSGLKIDYDAAVAAGWTP